MTKFVPVDFSKLERIHQTQHDLLPSYRCHKIVKAAKITGKEWDTSFDELRLAFGEIGCYILVDKIWLKRNGPISIGGYYVVYEDGYRSYSPERQFNEGYSAMKSDSVNKEEDLPTILASLGIQSAEVKERNEELFATVQFVLRETGALLENGIPRFRSDLTPSLVAALREPIVEKGLPITHIVVGTSVFGKLMTHPDFINLIDPVYKYSDIIAGKVATLFGSDLITDAYFSPDPDAGERHILHDVIALVSLSHGKVKDFICARV